MTQLDLNMSQPQKQHRQKPIDIEQRLRQEREEAHRCFKIHKSGRPWIFSDRERKLLKDYYGITNSY